MFVFFAQKIYKDKVYIDKGKIANVGKNMKKLKGVIKT
jgi:hypothetical protein